MKKYIVPSINVHAIETESALMAASVYANQEGPCNDLGWGVESDGNTTVDGNRFGGSSLWGTDDED